MYRALRDSFKTSVFAVDLLRDGRRCTPKSVGWLEELVEVPANEHLAVGNRLHLRCIGRKLVYRLGLCIGSYLERWYRLQDRRLHRPVLGRWFHSRFRSWKLKINIINQGKWRSNTNINIKRGLVKYEY